jgi:hypothetical protein
MNEEKYIKKLKLKTPVAMSYGFGIGYNKIIGFCVGYFRMLFK